MKMIIILIFLFGAIISAMALITSVFSDKINRLEDDVYKLKLDLTLGSDDKAHSNLNVESSKHFDCSGLTRGGNGRYVVFYRNNEEIARYKLDDES